MREKEITMTEAVQAHLEKVKKHKEKIAELEKNKQLPRLLVVVIGISMLLLGRMIGSIFL